jgi:hypothetical protein
VVLKKLQEVTPERLFPADHYYLVYRLPGAPFDVRVRSVVETERGGGAGGYALCLKPRSADASGVEEKV